MNFFYISVGDKKKLRGNTENTLYIKIVIKARMDCTTCFICQC